MLFEIPFWSQLLEQYYRKEPKIDIDKVDQKSPDILLIHGANATPRCFNYIKHRLPKANYFDIEYSTEKDFYYNLDRMKEMIPRKISFNVLSHSMGGIFAAHLHKDIQIESSISVSTPYEGVGFADWGRYMLPSCQLFKDVSTRAKPIIDLQNIDISHLKWKQVVTTRGSVPWLSKPNDSVVTVSSMTKRKDMELIFLDESHNEVLLSEDLIHIIYEDFWNETTK